MSAGSRNPSIGHRTKVPTQTGRNTSHGESANSPPAEDATGTSKSQGNIIRRPATKSPGSPTLNKKPLPASAGSAVRFANQYGMKKKRYDALRKELADKQKTAQDLYKEISHLREKVIACGANDPGKVEELKFEVGSIKQTVSPSIEQSAHSSICERQDSEIEKLAITNEFIESFETRLQEIPKKSHDLCREVLEKQSAFMTFVASYLISDNKTENDDNERIEIPSADIAVQLEVHLKNNESFRTYLEELKATEIELTTELTKNAQELYKEYQNLYSRIKELHSSEHHRDLQAQLNATISELNSERERNNQSKDRIRLLEQQLQKARAKIRELETHSSNDEAKIQQLQGNVKSLEAQLKQKDQAMEQRVKDMQRTLRTSEGLVVKVEKQRDTFESRLVELKEKMSNKESEMLGTMRELSEKLETATADVITEREKRKQTEDMLAEVEDRCKKLEEKSKQLCELAEQNKDFTITEGSHSENEIRLYNDLQYTRAELEKQKDKMLQLQQEKDEIIAVMHQAASHDEEDDSKQKLAAELVFKSNELQNLTAEYTELQRVARNAQARSGMLETQLMELHNRLHNQLVEGGNTAVNARVVELQQELSDMSNNLAEVTRQKDELETTLTQKQLELEQRDRVMREQSKFLKVRDELLGLLKGKNQQGNEETSNSDENNEYMEQIAEKTEAIQELYTTLESKQLQIMRLEKMVKLMEDQQDRAQAQRTRLETRIAQLELALQKNKENRSKGFGIL